MRNHGDPMMWFCVLIAFSAVAAAPSRHRHLPIQLDATNKTLLMQMNSSAAIMLSGFKNLVGAALREKFDPFDNAARFTQDYHDGGDRSHGSLEDPRFFYFDHPPKYADQYNNNHFFHAASFRQWIVLICVCIFLIFVDLFVLRKIPSTSSGHLLVILVWIIFALLYDMWILGSLGRNKCFEFAYGYILEWLLSMDNLFIFHLIFSSYKTPAAQFQKALYVGIAGAVVMRLAFFLIVATLTHAFGWFRWPLGALLVINGIQTVFSSDDDDSSVQDTILFKFLKRIFRDRLMDEYAPTPCLFHYNEKGQLQVTILFIVILLLEGSDLVFALDSVSAKVAQLPDQYIAFSSSVLAMYGLRAMFFVIEDLVETFELLKYGLALILIYIGVELMCSKIFDLSKAWTCIGIVFVFIICISASVVKQKMWLSSVKNKEADNLTIEKGP